MSNIETELRFIREELTRLQEKSGLRPVAVRTEVAAWMIGFKPTKFKALLRAKEIHSFRVDRVRLVAVAELERWVALQSQPPGLRYPKTRGKTEEEKIRAKMRR